MTSERDRICSVWTENDGLRICRDVTVNGTIQPQHVTYLWDEYGQVRLEWENHEEGSFVPPLVIMGPDYS